MSENTIRCRDGIFFSGRVELFLFNAQKVPNYETLLQMTPEQIQDAIIQYELGNNKIVTVGLQQIAKLLCGLTTNSVTHVGVGSGTNTVVDGDVDLQTAIGSRHAITNRYRNENSAKFDTFFGVSENNGTWNETGLFDAVSSGNMFARKLLSSPFVKSASNTALLAWTLTGAAV